MFDNTTQYSLVLSKLPHRHDIDVILLYTLHYSCRQYDDTSHNFVFHFLTLRGGTVQMSFMSTTIALSESNRIQIQLQTSVVKSLMSVS